MVAEETSGHFFPFCLPCNNEGGQRGGGTRSVTATSQVGDLDPAPLARTRWRRRLRWVPSRASLFSTPPPARAQREGLGTGAPPPPPPLCPVAHTPCPARLPLPEGLTCRSPRRARTRPRTTRRRRPWSGRGGSARETADPGMGGRRERGRGDEGGGRGGRGHGPRRAARSPAGQRQPPPPR